MADTVQQQQEAKSSEPSTSDASNFGTSIPSASTSATISTSTPLIVEPDASRNRLCIPGILGDPFLSFDVDEESGYLVTGSAVGSVCLWRLDHISEILLGDLSSTADLTAPSVSSIVAPTSSEIVCRVLASASDEGVKHVFLSDEQIFAVIGDQHIKIWGSWHDATCQVKKFDRQHDYKTCKDTYTLRCEKKVLVITIGLNEGVLLDLETMMQTPFKLEIPDHSTPMYFDAHHLILLQLTHTGVKLAQIYEVQTQRLMKTIVFEKEKKFYWGFQLVHHASPSSAAPATTTNASSSSPQSSYKPSSSLSGSSSSSSHPSSSSPNLLTYISCHNILKCILFSEIPNGPVVPNNIYETGIPRDRRSTHQLFISKIQVAKKYERVLCYLYEKGLFYVLTSDKKVKVYDMNLREEVMNSAAATTNDSSSSSSAASSPSAASLTTLPYHGADASHGRLLRKYRHIAGTFKLGYPYFMKKVGEKFIFYTADEGIFVLKLD